MADARCLHAAPRAAALLLLLLALGIPAVQAQTFSAQCASPYRRLTSASRNAAFNDGALGVEVCDNAALGQVLGGSVSNQDWLGPGWYRFVGGAGTQMPTQAPGTYACGTDFPGWLVGRHPAPGDGVSPRKMCFQDANNNTCRWSVITTVVACNGFFLYNLPAPPTTCLRYCTFAEARPPSFREVSPVLSALAG